MSGGQWVFAAIFASACCAAEWVAEVHTSNGAVQGTALPYGVNEYLGMKFASAKRFEAPVDFAGRYPEQPLQATDFGPACMQVGNSPGETYGSEDCLFANVWQPRNAKPGAGLPVVVFIYGGSNQFGETEPYNGSAFAARHNTVYASIAYRTGPLGWMAFPEDSQAGRATGAWGLLDQQAGLRWVQREIRNFGGDPSRVIIHGQSSGAMCVELHLIMPGSRGLMRGLVSESGGLSASALEGGFSTTEAVGKLANCSGRSLKRCLQLTDALTLTAQTYSFGWGPHVDKATIPAEPMSLLLHGHINNFSVIMGAQTNDSNKDLVEHPMNVNTYRRSVLETVGRRFLDRALKLYPPESKNLVQNVHTLGSLSSDRMLCGIRWRVNLVNKHVPGKAFMYRFNYWYQSNPKCTADPNYHDNTTGPRHEDEVTFVMGQPIFMFDGACCGKWGSRLKREPCQMQAKCVDCWDKSLGEGYHGYFNDKEWDFSQLVGGYWANLARYGTPNAPGAADWPVFTHGTVDGNIVLDANLPHHQKQEQSLYDNPAICSFWDVVDKLQSDVEDVTLPLTV
eukprot:TRINITY_DN26124_c0_g1_i1.p1 TRINITY_DN26124_c0_g1~~TRINITY_DN26124_c0_g1_i1.p1  ORF type:complete len:565 (-),score=76.23 TRINITY_DN26124_c0_g1_i1:258-1952(-)